MEYTVLGRTGIKVSRLCLGCMNFGGRQEKEDSIRIIHQALDAGINFVDTANVYGHEPLNFEVGRGRSEQIVGEALLRLTAGLPKLKTFNPARRSSVGSSVGSTLCRVLREDPHRA